MTLADVQDWLEQIDFPERRYSLNGSNREETYCIEPNPGRWAVYYAERGERVAEKVFTNESDACRHFIHLLVRDYGVSGPPQTLKLVRSTRSS